MTEPKRTPSAAAEPIAPPAAAPDALRERALVRLGDELAEPPEIVDPLQPDQARAVLHELRVHQIELEMQNEELRRTQLELEASRARYFDLYDLAPVGYLTLGPHGRILEANLTCATLFSVPRAALQAAHLSSFVAVEDHATYYEHLRHLYAGETSVFDLRLTVGNTRFWARFEGGAVQDTSKSPTYRLIVSDVSEAKRKIEVRERFDAQAHQVQKAESLGRMAGAIAHHFNNMLGGVLGNLELARGVVSEESETCELIDEAMLAAKRAAELSGLMLTYLGQASGEREPVDLSEASSRCLHALSSVLPKALVLDLELPPTGPVVCVNPNHLRQVLHSLLTNAWEATWPRLTPVGVSVKLIERPAIESTSRFPADWLPLDDRYACVEVMDRGVGVEVSDLPNLFDPFFSSKSVGRGLGLAAVLGIARAHRGAVTVQSTPGEGSVFRVLFPISSNAPVRRQLAPATRPAHAEGVTVLLVDDEEVVRKAAARMLETLGFVVLHAKSGREAVEIVWQSRSDIQCVVCDVTMPGMGGWETLEELRKLVPELPVVLTSGYSEEQVMDGAHTEQPDAFLPKPFARAQLEEAVGKALARSSH